MCFASHLLKPSRIQGLNRMSNIKTIRIATRASQLAIAQAEQVRHRLLAHLPHLTPEDITLMPVTTSGDKDQITNIAQWGYKGLFTKEVEELLLDQKADIAVHSMKDMPSVLPDGLIIAGMLEREDPHDAFISTTYQSLEQMPKGAILGTSSTRRSAIIRALRPDLEIVPFRGNVQTRLRKLESGEASATLLAAAGLKRLGLEKWITKLLPFDQMLPAIAQGAIGIECRKSDDRMRAILADITHAPTLHAVTAERAVLGVLDGSCKTPLSGYAQITYEQLTLRSLLLQPDGSEQWQASASGHVKDAEAIGKEVGTRLLSLAKDKIVL